MNQIVDLRNAGQGINGGSEPQVLIVVKENGRQGKARWVSAKMPSWATPRDLKLVRAEQGGVEGWRDEVRGTFFPHVSFPR